jgi:hypothetical protein
VLDTVSLPALDPNTFLIGSIAGTIGVGYFVYGKKQAKVVPMVCGALLCIYPYFIENLWITLVVGVVLGLVPVFLKE